MASNTRVFKSILIGITFLASNGCAWPHDGHLQPSLLNLFDGVVIPTDGFKLPVDAGMVLQVDEY